MKRWIPWITVVTAVLALAIAMRYAFKADAQKKREASYQSALMAYSPKVKPGLSRKEVEGYLLQNHIQFLQSCCSEGPAFSDLVEVGEEDHPWYCSEQEVFVAFEFSLREPLNALKPGDSDVLEKAEIIRRLGGCL